MPAVVTDRRGRVTFWNSAAETMFGRASRRAVGRRFPEVVHGRDVFGNLMVHEEDRFRALIESGEAIRDFALDIETASGRRQRVSASVLLVLGPGEAMDFVYHLRPVEARRKTDLVADSPERSAVARDGGDPAPLPSPTPRQLEILRLIAEGKTSAEISAVLGISYHTVRNHIQHLLERLGVHSRSEAVAVAIRHDLI